MAGGSFAAAWQASIGAIQSGSLFATLQSIAMGGIGGGTIALGGMTGAAIYTLCATVDKAAEQPGAVQDALLSAVAAIRARLSRNARRFRARL